MSGPTLLLILDGWGIAAPCETNAVTSAGTPGLDALFDKWPHTRLTCSGRAVGLPDGFMGNSEVGHMNIGAGRIVYQDMTRIDMAVEDGSLFTNETLCALMDGVKASGGRLHLMGLVSDGGVHSHQDHITALLDMAVKRGVSQTFVHAFLDGRDTPPKSGVGYVKQLTETMRETGSASVATVMGRYWAMDRDTRYDRNERAFKVMVLGEGVMADDPVRAVESAYGEGQTDEFVEPCVVDPEGVLRDGDAVFMFNFRADRMRQIVRSFFDKSFDGFDRSSMPALSGLATMTRYESSFPLPVAFGPVVISGTLGQVVSERGLKQLRIAETEKYAHVTYFLNCGREEPFEGEDRVLIPSPRDVATYDLKPEMSALEVTDRLLEELEGHDLCVCNLANLDMVGHSGVLEAARQAVRVVDGCVARLADKVLALGGRMLLTADHGNAEVMVSKSGGPHTAHSLNPVPLLYAEAGAGNAKMEEGILGDIAPTILGLMGIEPGEGMTGKNLVTK